MSAQTISEVLNRCALTRTWEQGMCGQFCAAMYGYGFSGYTDAIAQWQSIPLSLRHGDRSEPPAGALVFWGGGSAGHGHVAISDGAGGVWSIDICGAGTVCRVPTATISNRWGLPYLGWAEPYFQGIRWQPVGIYGVDVSAYQPINFALTTPGDGKPVSFVIIKITEGMTVLNSKWTAQRQWARDHGLSVGFYHFARPGSMVDQADRFLNQVALQPGDHLWFDWEDAGVSCAQKDAWISYVQGRAPGHRVGLYCNTDFWKNRDTTSFAGDGLWIATGGIPAGAPPIQSSWLIHQYSTAGDYDHDLAQFATKADMITWAKGPEDMALSPDDKKWISAEIKSQVSALLSATSLVDSKVHGAGYYLAHAEKSLTDSLAQAKANGSSLTEIKTVLAQVRDLLGTLDLSHVAADVAAKIESLKVNAAITVTEGN